MSTATITDLLSRLGEVINNPADNTRTAVLLMAALVVLVLIVALVGVLFVLPAGKRRPVDAVGSAPRADRRAWLAGPLGSAVIVLAVASSLASGYAFTSQDRYCLYCHVPAGDGGVAAAQGDAAHGGASCVSCHEEPGALLGNAVARVGDVSARLGSGDPGHRAVVRSGRCLACHTEDVAAPSVDTTTGVAMSHAEPLAAGWACADCHKGGGHAPVVEKHAMSQCLVCHNAEDASAACETCHTTDVAAASGLSAERVFGRAAITSTDCEGCHSMENCDACHGLRMPHPEEFLKTHPRYAGFDRKQQCLERCHTQADCGACHGAWNSHGANFRDEHMSLPRDSACTTCHSRHEGSMCALCHDFGQ